MHCVFLYYQEGLANLYDTLIYDLHRGEYLKDSNNDYYYPDTIKSGVCDQDGPAWVWAG